MSESEWVTVLRVACAAKSQAAVARALGYSPSVINQVLKGFYRGDLGSVEAKVRALLIKESVLCPGLERVIKRAFCLEFQEKAVKFNRGQLQAASSLHQQIYSACLGGCRYAKNFKGEANE
ncbi:hypothetical protein [Candidatus Cyanaurora vandensis]|uniref:hypothetical protein n=1 Tax=Candidatus Cyanaurora vandensis TaxID=2714958 RepID=UPI00257A4805|nr:hypothetical protein [Candidatus Cyanaurora vandensis]